MRQKLNPNLLGIGIGLIVVIAIIIGISVFISKSSNKTKSNKNAATYNAQVMGHSGASIDSERQFAPDEQWKGQRSKCFDCEQEVAQSCGNKAVFNATKQKLFSV